jgi:Holliday junction resolvasome RuvABC endonuclease subunit
MSVTMIGIDPSLTATGYAHTDSTLTTIQYDKASTGDLRLMALYGWLTRVLRVEKPTHAVIEDLPTHAHGAGITGMVQGVVRLTLLERSIPYRAVTAATLKKFATGRGNAPKDDMRMELYKRTGLDVPDNNQMDAYWLRELGLHLAGQPTIELPKTHLVALEKVEKW